MASNVFLVIIITSLATYLSRFLGVISAENIKETSKIFRWFNCLAYSTLAALIARITIFPAGDLAETHFFIRLIVVILSLIIFFLTKKNLVYPTIFSALMFSFLNLII
tara:strand:- start:141 stop:464 length:324 start_codon:yes stop_codon:yes gene_type:complete